MSWGPRTLCATTSPVTPPLSRLQALVRDPSTQKRVIFSPRRAGDDGSSQQVIMRWPKPKEALGHLRRRSLPLPPTRTGADQTPPRRYHRAETTSSTQSPRRRMGPAIRCCPRRTRGFPPRPRSCRRSREPRATCALSICTPQSPKQRRSAESSSSGYRSRRRGQRGSAERRAPPKVSTLREGVGAAGGDGGCGSGEEVAGAKLRALRADAGTQGVKMNATAAPRRTSP